MQGSRQEENRKAAAQELATALSHSEKFKVIYNKLIEQPQSERVTWLKEHARRHARKLNTEQLVSILDALLDNNRVEVATKCMKNIKSPFDFGRVLRTLPIEHCVTFCEKHYQMNWPADPILASLPLDEITPFLERHPDMRFLDSSWILSLFPEQERAPFARKFKGRMRTKDITTLMEVLPADEHDALLKEVTGKIENIYQLATVLKYSSTDQRIPLVEKHREMLSSNDNFVIVLEAFPEQERAPLITRFKERIQNGSDLARMLDLLPPDEQDALVETHADKIQDIYQLANVLQRLTVAQGIPVTERHRGMISTKKSFATLLTYLPVEDRPAFSEKFAPPEPEAVELSASSEEAEPPTSSVSRKGLFASTPGSGAALILGKTIADMVGGSASERFLRCAFSSGK